MIRPLFNGVLVRRLDSDEVTPAGLVLPDTAKEKSQRGEVVAIGPGLRQPNGEGHLPMNVQPGNHVLLPKYGGVEVTYHGETLIVFKEDDLLAIL